MLKKGQKVKIKLMDSSVDDVEFYTKVDKIASDRISLEFPDEKMYLADTFAEGEEIELTIFTDRGVLVLDSIVIDCPYEPHFVVEFHNRYENIQRREHARTLTNVEVKMHLDYGILSAKALNLSAGGALVELPEDCNEEINKTYLIEINLVGENNSALGNAKLIKIDKEDGKILGVLEFINISEADKNRIIRFVFENDAKYMRKNL